MFLCSFSISSARVLRSDSACLVFQYFSKTFCRLIVAIRLCALAEVLITQMSKMPAENFQNRFFINTSLGLCLFVFVIQCCFVAGQRDLLAMTAELILALLAIAAE